MNGTEYYSGSRPEEYTTSIIGNYSVNFIHDVAAGAAGGKPIKPFHLVIGPRAPHNPMTPAEWYMDSLPGLRVPRTAAYNYSAVGHVPFIAEEPPLSSHDEARLDKQFNDRWRTLLSVDDLVGDVVAALEETGLAANTYVFYSSECDFLPALLFLCAPLAALFASCVCNHM